MKVNLTVCGAKGGATYASEAQLSSDEDDELLSEEKGGESRSARSIGASDRRILPGIR
jgi:hypothetical protein